jgi:hypothetical protein
MRLAITVAETAGVPRLQAPVEIGVPLPAGQAQPDDSWTVLDEEGQPVPSQFKPLLRFADGSLRAAHGIFLLDLAPNQIRTLTLANGSAPAAGPLLTPIRDGFYLDTGPMQARFNERGELASLRFAGSEHLDLAAGLSLVIEVSPGPAGGGLIRSALTARIKEAGPVRAILTVEGELVGQDRRGDVALRLDADYVFYAGRAEIHLRPMLLGAVTDHTLVSHWGVTFGLRNGGRVVYGRDQPLIRLDPDHENMTWRGLDRGWASWELGDTAAVTVWSEDFARHQNGMVRTRVLDEARRRMRVTVHRLEPQWGYQDVSNPPKPVAIVRGSWRRWEAVIALHRSDEDRERLACAWRAPLRAFPAPDHYRQALHPRLEGESRSAALWSRVARKCEEFICAEPEYAGSIHGGWDGPNRAYIERGVARGDFGEYLFNEFYRTAEPRFYRMAFDFGRIYRDVFCFTIAEASDGPHELGGARARSSEFRVCSIRSYRGAVLLARMYHETGDERYRAALQQRAAYHLANYPHSVGRVSMSVWDSAFLADYLQQPALGAKALAVARHSLDRHFDPGHGFYEAYDQTQTLPDGRFPPAAIPDGYWFMRDFLRASNASPEMTAYNIIGWYGLSRFQDFDPELSGKIRRVCEWFRDRQNPDGSWPYPHDTSKTRWGHGCLQDALAMLYAYRLFRDPSYLEAARKSIDFAQACFARYGKIPLLLGLLPHAETEDSLTYYYGLETLAVYNEIQGNNP